MRQVHFCVSAQTSTFGLKLTQVAQTATCSQSAQMGINREVHRQMQSPRRFIRILNFN